MTNKIKFSHRYIKMPGDLAHTFVKDVALIHYDQLTPEQIEQDTAIVGGGNYKLPKTKLIWVKLVTNGYEWATLRRFTTDKLFYYTGLVGRQVEIVIKPPKHLEIVICAAVKAKNGKVYRGHRHGDCIRAIIDRGLKPSESQYSQGFITSKNRYVTREVGRRLQEAAGIPSADPEGYRGKTLFSEDLY